MARRATASDPAWLPWCKHGGLRPIPHSLSPTTSPPSPVHDGTLQGHKGKHLVADVVLDADGDAVEQPFLPLLLYFLELLLTLWNEMSQAVCLLGHFQGLCKTCGEIGVKNSIVTQLRT